MSLPTPATCQCWLDVGDRVVWCCHPDVRPPLDTLAVCMGLPDRESNYDRTRGEALAIAIVICAALAFTAYRMLILKRFGDFSWGVTVARHRLFWFGYFMGLLDLITRKRAACCLLCWYCAWSLTLYNPCHRGPVCDS